MEDIRIAYTKAEFNRYYNMGYIYAATMGESGKSNPHIAMFLSEEDAQTFLLANPVEIMLNTLDKENATIGLKD